MREAQVKLLIIGHKEEKQEWSLFTCPFPPSAYLKIFLATWNQRAERALVRLRSHVHEDQEENLYFLPVMASEENNPNLRLLSGGPRSTLDGSRETSIFRQEDMRGDVKINKHSDERNFSVPSFQSNTCSLKKICPILYRQEVKLFINKNHT